MTDGAFLLWSVFITAAPILLIFISRIIGISFFESNKVSSLAKFLSSIGSLIFVLSALFLASRDIGAVAGIGLFPGMFIIFALNQGMESLIKEFKNTRKTAQ